MPFEEEGFGSPLSSPRSPQEVESRRRKQAIFRRHMALRQGRPAHVQCEGQQEKEEKPAAELESSPPYATISDAIESRPKSIGRLALKHRGTLAPYERALAARKIAQVERAKSESSLSDSKDSDSKLQASESTTPRAVRAVGSSQSRRKIELVRKLAEKKFFSRSEPSTPERSDKCNEFVGHENDLEDERLESPAKERNEDSISDSSGVHENVPLHVDELSVSIEANEVGVSLRTEPVDIAIAQLSESKIEKTTEIGENVNVEDSMTGSISVAELEKSSVSKVDLTTEMLEFSRDDPERNEVTDPETAVIAESEETEKYAEPIDAEIASGVHPASFMEYVSLNDSNLSTLNDSNLASSAASAKLHATDSHHPSFGEYSTIDLANAHPRMGVSGLTVLTNLTESENASSVLNLAKSKSPMSKSHRYDMRSIHDQFDDPSWDISKVAFNINTDTGRKHVDYDIFDTASWVEASDVTFATPRGGQASSHLFDHPVAEEGEEEKKESNSMLDTSPENVETISNETHETVKADQNLNVAIMSEHDKSLKKERKTSDESPTWDAAKVMFPADLKKTTDENDGLNMFDTASWAPSSVGLSTWSETMVVDLHPDIEAEVSRLMNEGTIAADNDAESDQEVPVPVNVDKDDVPLLEGEEARSDVADELHSLAMRLLGKLGNSANRLDKKERVEAYIAQEALDTSSVEEDAEHDNESESFDTIDQVRYMEHGEENGNCDELISPPLHDDLLVMHCSEAPLIEPYPTFDPASAAVIDLTPTSDTCHVGAIILAETRDAEHENAIDSAKLINPVPAAAIDLAQISATAMASDSEHARDETAAAVSDSAQMSDEALAEAIDRALETTKSFSGKKSGDRARPSPENPPLINKRTGDRSPRSPGKQPAASDDGAIILETLSECFTDTDVVNPVPPPPPPPLESKRSRSGKKKKKKRSTNEVRDIPKIAPPPEEKLRKWAESRRQPLWGLGIVDNIDSDSEPQGIGLIDNIDSDSELQGIRHKIDEETNRFRLEFQQDVSPVHAARVRALESALKRVGNRCGKSDCEVGMTEVDIMMSSNDISPLVVQTIDLAAELPTENISKSETVERVSDMTEVVQRRFDNKGIERCLNESLPAPIQPDAPQALTKYSHNFTCPAAGEQLSLPVPEGQLPASNGFQSSLLTKGVDGADAERHATSQSPAVTDQVADNSAGQGGKEIEPKFSVLLACRGKQKVKQPYRSSEKPSPQVVLVKDVVAGSKMAEKLALASSAAARKFEEQYVPRLKIDLEHPIEHDSKRPVEKVGKEHNQSQSESVSALSYFCVPQTVDEDELNVTIGSVGIVETSGLDLDSVADMSESLGKPPLWQENTKSQTNVELFGGAFSPWRNPKTDTLITKDNVSDMHSKDVQRRKDASAEKASKNISKNPKSWFLIDVLKMNIDDLSNFDDEDVLKLLHDNENFNVLCKHVAESVNLRRAVNLPASDNARSSGTMSPARDNADRVRQQPILQPFQFPARSNSNAMLDAPSVLAANFVSFLYRVAKATGTQSPFGDENPFLREIIGSSMRRSNDAQSPDSIADRKAASMQGLLFEHGQGQPIKIIEFAFTVCNPTVTRSSNKEIVQVVPFQSVDSVAMKGKSYEASVSKGEFDVNLRHVESSVRNLNLIVPVQRPSPFETATWNNPGFLLTALGFIGDPVAVCRMKVVNRFCNRVIKENEHIVMRDAVRLGGLSMHLRPSFWMWITLEKCGQQYHEPSSVLDAIGSGNVESVECRDSHCGESSDLISPLSRVSSLTELERIGRTGKWHSVIERDVSRAFGNMPPHKTGARLRTDSIVRALVTWGRNRIMKRGVKGSGEGPSDSGYASTDRVRKAHAGDDGTDGSETSQTPTDTVSDWGGVSPVGSFTSSMSGVNDGESDRQKAHLFDKLHYQADASVPIRGPQQAHGARSRQSFVAEEDLALGGNALTDDMKIELQDKLGYILYALAAAHQDVGYCQGMDYVVAHLLRILQDTVLWRAGRGTLPPVIRSAACFNFDNGTVKNIGDSHVVEETVFRVMDTFFTTYNLRHMYWPELRCLKTCCRVFERLIQIKLPVLADHFEHHDLNVGLFALGWFQTLFLYLPSMPSATVCHMWDIWLVERSFKIFFRVGTAILFLSQPILLNHDLEGMMTYLNTFPDATLLNPDILIACALQIKVTNKMLMDIEIEITGGI